MSTRGRDIRTRRAQKDAMCWQWNAPLTLDDDGDDAPAEDDGDDELPLFEPEQRTQIGPLDVAAR